MARFLFKDHKNTEPAALIFIILDDKRSYIPPESTKIPDRMEINEDQWLTMTHSPNSASAPSPETNSSYAIPVTD
ncbi:MAG: hypothetical protein KYX62_06445 [Pseudomonadota bacterium]|nr:hypothetical protein [Pseudomonadota bacterium]